MGTVISIATYNPYPQNLNASSVINDSTYIRTLNVMRASNVDTTTIDSLEANLQRTIQNIDEANKKENFNRGIKGVSIGAIAGIIVALIMSVISRILVKRKIRKLTMELILKGAETSKENIDKDFFTNLVDINFKYLDLYYLQTQEQANKSFWMSAVASGIGFIVIIIGVSMMFQSGDKTKPAYITTGAGILSEFIAAVFFYLYNKTVLKMSQYHQKLVITQNISLALKTAGELTNSKEKVLESIIDKLTFDVNKYLSGELKD